MPVIVEDDVLVGGNCGIYEGTIVKRRAVLGTGTILNRSTPVYDLVRLCVQQGERRAAAGDVRHHVGTGQGVGISVYTPVIVKFRDARTDAKIQLEDSLR